MRFSSQKTHSARAHLSYLMYIYLYVIFRYTLFANIAQNIGTFRLSDLKITGIVSSPLRVSSQRQYLCVCTGEDTVSRLTWLLKC